MRIALIASLALPLALAACSGGDEDVVEEDAGLSGEEVAAQLEAAPRAEPGQYETSVELLEFEVPGMPASQTDAVKQMMAVEFSKASTFCLTPEQAEEGPQRMVQQMAESNCTFGRYDVTGSSIDGEMTCTGEQGFDGTVRVSGTMSGDTSSMTMETIHKVPGMPGEGARMKMQMDSRRIGECPG